MKKAIIFLLAMTLLINYAVSQQKDPNPGFAEFNRSFSKNFKYPFQLEDRCISTVTLMMVTFRSDGSVDLIEFSDSVLDQFKNEFFKVKDKIDFKSVFNDIININQENKVVVIPIFIESEKTGPLGCESNIIASDLKNLYNFSGKPISGNYYLYSGLYIINAVVLN